MPVHDSQFLSLRAASYEAGIRHDRAFIECNDALMHGRYEESRAAVARHNTAAREYGVALAELADHLRTLGQTPEVADELARAERLIELLDHEMAAAEQRLALLGRRRPDAPGVG